MSKLKRIKAYIEAWKNDTCPHIEQCKKEGKYNKKQEGFDLLDCPKRCLEDDWDYLENISCIIGGKS